MANTISATRRQLTRLALGACLTLFAACAGESPTKPGPTPPPTPAPVANGVLAIAVTGLDAGQPADIVVTGPAGFSRAITASGSVGGLVAGRYTVSARTVSANGRNYVPVSSTQDVDVGSDGVPVTSTVAYRLEAGVVIVTVSGLPDGEPADITLTPPAGARIGIAATRQLDGALPGRWNLAASAVASGGHTYKPTPPDYDVTLAPNDTARMPVEYALATGAIAVAVTGLPSGMNGIVLVTGPGGYSQAVTGTTTLTGLVPGEYTVSATPVTAGVLAFAPVPAVRNVTVKASLVAEPATMNYDEQLGRLELTISGLGSEAADVLVTGPGGFTQTVTATTTLTGLTPGLYTLNARNVRTTLGTFGATPATRSVTVTSGGNPTGGVVYAALPAVVHVPVSGLPIGTSAAITVTPPSGIAFAISSTIMSSPAATGRWRLSAADVVSGGTTFRPTPRDYDQTLLAGDTLRFPVAYTSSAPVVGNLIVTLSGLPIGASGHVSVSGPGGFAQTVTTSSTLQNLAPGSYTLNASAVSSGGDSYTPSPSSASVQVNAGATSNASFTYAPAGGGSPNLSIDNVYVTQAAQNWNGTAHIVTGRDALVRVFVKSSTANTLQPDVRVRVYEGGTLIQTATITAPAGSVPTSISEGNLGSSWNLRIAAGNVRAGLRILADVDPLNVIGESNRADNTWPSDGNAANIGTATVPALTVRFVPVTLNGVTGNVTNSNKDQFLAMTRLVMPVQGVSSSVRAAFTSNASPLESNNGNGAWSTVLSEINALRTVDGAAANVHYYGVVKAGYSSGVAGIAYVPGRAAVGWDALPSGDRVAAHELGHNFSRPHTPCGVSGDGQYPYSGGSTGVYGWNATTNAVVPTTWTDVMGYCSNQWISDWTWSKVIEYRSISGYDAATAVVGDGLLIWGRVIDGRIVLEPAFRVRARPTPRASTSTHRVLLADGSGTTLADIPIEPHIVDHALDERQFAVVVPWSDALERSVTRLSVVDSRVPFRSATRTSSNVVASGSDNVLTAVLPDPNVTVKSTGLNRSDVQWNSARYPMAMVRDSATGEILSFLRSSGDGFLANGRAVDIVFSDGVRSTTRQVRGR